MSADRESGKRPTSRKLAVWGFYGLGALCVVATIMVMIKDPTAQRRKEKVDAAQGKIERQAAGSEAEGIQAVSRIAQRVDREQGSRRSEREKALAQFGSNSSILPGAPSDSRASGAQGKQQPAPLDPAFVKMLSEASAEANKAPTLSQSLRSRSGGGSGPNSISNMVGAKGGTGIVYDNYGKGIAGKLGEATSAKKESAEDDLFGDASKVLPGAKNSAETGIYEATKPQDPPSRLIVSQGTLVPAQLLSAIDTRNAGQITAVVSRTIYDSFTHQTPLLPQGSKLIGSYQSSVSAGASRLAMSFTRIILPNGRSVALNKANVASQDGTIGIKGKYHSNILRLVGPALFTAALGEWVDEEVTKDDAAEAAAEASGSSYYSKGSVLEQTMPSIISSIQQRYSNAKPYMTLKPGQDIRLVLSQDLQFERTDGQVAP